MDQQPTFVLCQTIGDNTYEIEGYIEGPLLRLKITREFPGEGKPERRIQSVVFPLEILNLVHREIFGTPRKNNAELAAEARVEQVKAFLDDNLDIIRTLMTSEESAKEMLSSFRDEIGCERDGLFDMVAAIVRTLAVLYAAKKV